MVKRNVGWKKATPQYQASQYGDFQRRRNEQTVAPSEIRDCTANLRFGRPNSLDHSGSPWRRKRAAITTGKTRSVDPLQNKRDPSPSVDASGGQYAQLPPCLSNHKIAKSPNAKSLWDTNRALVTRPKMKRVLLPLRGIRMTVCASFRSRLPTPDFLLPIPLTPRRRVLY